MKIYVYVEKKTATLAGSDAYGWLLIDVPAAKLTEEQRAALVAHGNYYEARTVAPQTADYTLSGRNEPVADEEAVLRILDYHVEADRKVKQTQTEQAAEALARFCANCTNPICDTSLDFGLCREPYLEYYHCDRLTPVQRDEATKALAGFRLRVKERREQIAADWRKRAAEYLAGGEPPYLPPYHWSSPVPDGITNENVVSVQAEVARRAAAAAAAEKAAIAATITQQSPADIDRFSDGTMPKEEVVRRLRTHLLAPLLSGLPSEQFPRYNELEAADIEHDENCSDDTESSIAADPVTEYPANVWAARNSVVKALAINNVTDAVVTVHPHTVSCDECSASVSRWAIHLKRTTPLAGTVTAVLRLAVPDGQ